MSQTLPLFRPPDSRTAFPSLIERITAYRPRCTAKHVPATEDRWVLASNLQKAIRRGLVPYAEATAVRLLAVDPSYFWRRLLVIGYEDIGYGDIGLCHDLLKTFRRAALHRQLGPQRVAAYFACKLALACKNRSLCDALAMLEFSVKRDEYERQCFAFPDDQLLAAACDTSAPVMDRVAALRHVCGYRVFAHGVYQAGVPARTEIMHEVCRRHELTEVETRLFMSGQGVSDSLNIPVPMVALMAGGTRQEHAAEQRFSGRNGILYASLDRHTRAGKRCYARLAKEVRPVREYFAHHPEVNPVAVLGAAIFVIEGSTPDRQLKFDGSDALEQQFEQNFIEYAGISSEQHPELLAVVMSSLPRLNRFRAEEMS